LKREKDFEKKKETRKQKREHLKGLERDNQREEKNN
jgi:hypothetical protein